MSKRSEKNPTDWKQTSGENYAEIEQCQNHDNGDNDGEPFAPFSILNQCQSTGFHD
jgi:hypothetical protein